MAIGTACFTAALSVHRLEERGPLVPGNGPVLVTGATGGVGSTAVAILAEARLRGPSPSTGKAEQEPYLREARRLGGAAPRRAPRPSRAGRSSPGALGLAPVDCVGGATLAYVLSRRFATAAPSRPAA